MRILITGGAGYVGHRLVPALLKDGHEVVVYDMLWFGDFLQPHVSLMVIEGDIRNTENLATWMKGCDAVLHLACISNDPSVELDESLSRTINYEAFEPMVVAAKKAGVGRFIYCSTSSVYGVSDSPDVAEDHPLVPLTLYNTYKGQCEPLLFKHQSDDFICTVIRPSTICGYSPRQRLDLAVNILTNLAWHNGVITVFGGEQKRPNLHIEDMVDCYQMLLEAPSNLIQGETFNVGQQNATIMELAEIVRGVVEEQLPLSPITIKVEPIHDERSYQVNSDKIKNVLGYKPKRSVESAVRALCHAFREDLLPDPLSNDIYYNVKQMRRIWEDVYKDAPPSAFDPALIRRRGICLRLM
jgi:nucleoside-diphosphate-sugar epimerase